MNQERLQEMWNSSSDSVAEFTHQLKASTRAHFVLRQTFEYRYSGPVTSLRQRLVVIPPLEHGGQRLVFHRLSTEPGASSAEWSTDRFGNSIACVRIGAVPESIRFEVDVVIEREPGLITARLPSDALRDRIYLDPTTLTQPDDALASAARVASSGSASHVQIAERLCRIVHEALAYRKGATSVTTPAADALATGAGVCQDHAHVMIAMCRTLGVPARYVSGHMLGEGQTHAWVEVLVADPDDPDAAVALPFDPCHFQKPDLRYVTVAVGRDYADVAPASGTYSGSYSNRLISTTRLGVTVRGD